MAAAVAICIHLKIHNISVLSLSLKRCEDSVFQLVWLLLLSAIADLNFDQKHAHHSFKVILNVYICQMRDRSVS